MQQIDLVDEMNQEVDSIYEVMHVDMSDHYFHTATGPVYWWQQVRSYSKGKNF